MRRPMNMNESMIGSRYDRSEGMLDPNNQIDLASLIEEYSLSDVEKRRIEELRAGAPQQNADARLIEKYNTWTAYQNLYNEKAREQIVQELSKQDTTRRYLTEEEARALYPNSKKAHIMGSEQLLGQYNQINNGYAYPLPEDGWVLKTNTGLLGIGEDALDAAAKRRGKIFNTPEEAMALTVPYGYADQYAYHTSQDGTIGRRDEGTAVPGFNRPVGQNIYKYDDVLDPSVQIGLREGDNPEDFIQVGFAETRPGQDLVPAVVRLRGSAINDIKQAEELPPIQTYEPMGFEPQPVDKGYNVLPVIPMPENHPQDPVVEEDVVEDDKQKDKISDTDKAILMNQLANGLKTWNLQGVNIGVPRFDQPRYASPTLGPAVRNLFRG